MSTFLFKAIDSALYALGILKILLVVTHIRCIRKQRFPYPASIKYRIIWCSTFVTLVCNLENCCTSYVTKTISNTLYKNDSQIYMFLLLNSVVFQFYFEHALIICNIHPECNNTAIKMTSSQMKIISKEKEKDYISATWNIQRMHFCARTLHISSLSIFI